MTRLFVAALVWILIHRLISGGPLRGWLVGRLGETKYQALFAALSALTLAALAISYAGARPDVIAPSPLWLVLMVMGIQLFASLLVVAGLSTANPATAGMGGTVGRPNFVRGALRIMRHPFLWGVLLWSVAHLIVRFDLAGILFFGSLGFVAWLGTWSIDRKRRLAHGKAWEDFAQQTSSIPFAAIARGRQPLVLREIGIGRLSVGVLMWAAMLLAHPYLSAGTDVLSRIGLMP